MRWPIYCWIFVFVAGHCAAQGKTVKRPDAEAIVGEWKVTSFVEEGEITPPEKYRSMRYVSTDGKGSIKIDGKVVAKFTLKLDSSKEPKQIDTELSEEHQIGIYKLDGDKLTLCARAYIDNGDRPTEFKSVKDSGLMLIEFERIKK